MESYWENWKTAKKLSREIRSTSNEVPNNRDGITRHNNINKAVKSNDNILAKYYSVILSFLQMVLKFIEYYLF